MDYLGEDSDNLCPLCLDAMDDTDRQLKPCKCGYQICVWCFHEVINMAERENMEGRCPACRTPYDKEKIYRERPRYITSDKRQQKSQKSKAKSSESRKHLSSVRVIQRNLVYISGIPAHLADEETLERKEFFGQYGKVLKVSISRSNATNQHSSSSPATNVYITYTNEEEALRCIQVVNGFILEGKPLRACFGTTKYCHAWLKNMPCNNPECLYLHDVGVPEDSFTKEEMVSTGISKVQLHITNSSQRRSGNYLPPPETDGPLTSACSSAKAPPKLSASISGSQAKCNASNVSAGKSTGLPAAASWGQRSGQGKALPTKTPAISLSTKQKSCSSLVLSASPPSNMLNSPTMATSQSTSSASTIYQDTNKKTKSTDSSKQNVSKIVHVKKASSKISGDPDSVALLDSVKSSSRQNSPEKRSVESIISHTASINENNNQLIAPSAVSDWEQFADLDNNEGSTSEFQSVSSNLLRVDDQDGSVTSIPESSEAVVIAESSKCIVVKEHEVCAETETSRGYSSSPFASDVASENGLAPSDATTLGIAGSKDYSYNRVADDKIDNYSSRLNGTESYTGLENLSFSLNDGYPSENQGHINPRNLNSEDLQDSDKSMRNIISNDVPESSIISDILSMNLDDCSQDLLKVLQVNNDATAGLDFSSTRKPHNTGQSRFSFAREEEAEVKPSGVSNSYTNHNNVQELFSQVDSPSMRNFGNDLNNSTNGFSGRNQSDSATITNHSGVLHIPDTSVSQVTLPRSHISAPPGFSVPTRIPTVPPPGFSLQPRADRHYDWTIGSVHPNRGSENHDASPLSSTYSFSSVHQGLANGCTNDVELIDPAIMAVGRGKLPTEIIQPSHGGYDSIFRDPMQDFNQPFFGYKSRFSGRASPVDYDARLQMLSQKSFQYANASNNMASSRQQFKIQDQVGDYAAFLPSQNDGLLASRIREQVQVNMDPSLSNLSIQEQIDSSSRSSSVGLNGWNDWTRLTSAFESSLPGRRFEVNTSELPNKERFGLLESKNGLRSVYSNYDDTKFHITQSEDYYCRQYGI